MRPTRLLVSVFLGCLSLALFAGWYFLFRDTSLYAPYFSEAAFHRVQAGMTVDEVIELLGKPIRIDESPAPETWTYVIGVRVDEANQAVLEGELSQVSFSDFGRVTSVSGPAASVVREGMSPAEVKALLGEPRWRSGPRARVMHYSEPAAYGVFHARIIELDDKGRVRNKISYAMPD